MDFGRRRVAHRRGAHRRAAPARGAPWTVAAALTVLVLVLVLAGAGCGVSVAPQAAPSSPSQASVLPESPTSTAPANPSDPATPGPGTGGDSSSYAYELAQLLAVPKRPPVDPLAVLALLLQPSGPPYKTGPNPRSPVVTPPYALPSGDGTVYAVGDSVLLGTQSYLPSTLGGWDLRFDARVGRSYPEGLDILRDNRASLGQAAIIGLGHNYWGGGKIVGYLDQLMALMPKVQRVIVMTVTEWSPAQIEVNRAVRALPQLYPNVVVADWQAVIAANPQFLLADGVHLTKAGSVALANLFGVLLGPAKPNGRTVPPPRILPLPDDDLPGAPRTTTTVPPAPSSTTTTPTTPGTGSTTTTTVGTTTTRPSSTTTTP